MSGKETEDVELKNMDIEYVEKIKKKKKLQAYTHWTVVPYSGINTEKGKNMNVPYKNHPTIPSKLGTPCS